MPPSDITGVKDSYVISTLLNVQTLSNRLDLTKLVHSLNLHCLCNAIVCNAIPSIIAGVSTQEPGRLVYFNT